jgi:hypothetical protein
VKRSLAVLSLALVIAACSTTSSPPTTLGVDGAPQLLRDTYLTVTKQAAVLIGYDATDDEWLEFARSVCAAGIGTVQELSAFVNRKAGSKPDPSLHQMWTTAATAATSAFCPVDAS